ncbi:MAG: hypothetical protein JST89_13615 [Cyanobacteria bacterium SZAS-4]|nr:hypothetical protein [Cyanobacteria bacterium SZAS-4]
MPDNNSLRGKHLSDIDFTTILNWLGLALSLGLTGYGVVGISSGTVKASSYAFMNDEKTFSGTRAKLLSISWIVFGLLGTVAFGGFIMKIKALTPLHDFVFQMMGS